jgi:hypothetical protein
MTPDRLYKQSITNAPVDAGEEIISLQVDVPEEVTIMV